MAKLAHKAALPAKKHPRDVLDVLVYFFTFTTPLFELPQLIEIYSRHSAQDVSLWTWAFFCLDNIIWIAYAFKRRLWPVLFGSIMYEIFEVGILIGILIYK